MPLLVSHISKLPSIHRQIILPPKIHLNGVRSIGVNNKCHAKPQTIFFESHKHESSGGAAQNLVCECSRTAVSTSHCHCHLHSARWAHYHLLTPWYCTNITFSAASLLPTLTKLLQAIKTISSDGWRMQKIFRYLKFWHSKLQNS